MEPKRLTCFKCGYVQRPLKLRTDAYGWVDRFYRRDPNSPDGKKICGQCHSERSYKTWKQPQVREQKERFNGEPEFDLGRHCDRRELDF